MIITAITPQKRRAGRVSIFIDGAFAFGMTQDDAGRCNLSEGMTLTGERLAYIMNEVIFSRARDTALRYLSSRQRTLAETFKRLKEEKYPPSVIKRVLALMVKCRYIDDRQYARDYIDSRLRAYYGIYRIKQELRARGVKTETIDDAASRAEFDEAAAITEYLRRYRKIFNADALRRRGFSNDGIRKASKLLSKD